MASLRGYQVSLLVPVDALDALAEGLTAMEQAPVPVSRLEVRAAPGEGQVLALLSFASPTDAVLSRGRIRTLAETVRGEVTELTTLVGDARAALEARLEKMTLHAEGEKDAKRVVTDIRHQTRARLKLVYGTLDELLAAWAQQVMEGALFVPDNRPPPTVPEVAITFIAAGVEYRGLKAEVVTRSPVPGRPGFWLKVVPTPELAAVVEKQARLKRQGRPAPPPPPGVRRTTERFEAVLDVQFQNLDGLATMYASDISRGGLFVRCTPQPALGTRIDVRLTLPGGAVLQLPSVVTRRVEDGATPGVGVSFACDEGALQPIEELLAQFRARKPRVLIVDDEAIWRSTLSRALKPLGVDVRLAQDGKDGLLKLLDGFFELDLVILDLHMPNLDGRGLISRIRAQGGEWNLRVLFFSGVGADELEDLRRSGLANGVFSKTAPLDELVARVAHELNLPPPR